MEERDVLAAGDGHALNADGGDGAGGEELEVVADLTLWSYTSFMEMTLTPEVERRLELRLREGRWKTASEVLETALDFLDGMEDVIVLNRKELDAKIQEGLDSADRGELYTEEEVRAHLAEVRAQLDR
jgi:predicted transcriptional regulator